MNQKVQSKNGSLMTLPMFANVYKMETVLEQNKKNDWWGWKITLEKSINDLKRVIVYPFNEFVFNQNNRKINADSFLTDLSTYELNDLIVHVDHGIGRFKGLKTISVLGSNHDCVEIHYLNDDKLFIPVENIELLSKYGGKNDFVVLDRLGATQWQYRKAVAKNKIND